jgi:WD40 repeat protein
MRRSFISRYVFNLGVLAALLAGCKGPQPPIEAPAPMSFTHPHGIGPAQKRDLLYVSGSTGSFAYVYLFSYPQGKLVGKIAKQITGLCSDSHGNVYMTQSYDSTSTIFEYAHDAKKPLATLSDPYNGAHGCAVDPITGNLAVANSDGETVVVYEHARGKPKTYYIWFGPQYVAYDPKGHLYALGGTGKEFALLSGGLFRRVRLGKPVGDTTGAQWDGEYMALGGETGYYYYRGRVDRYAISGRKGVPEGITNFSTGAVSFYIDASTVITTDGYGKLNFFAYPGGGSPTKTISGFNNLRSITVSVAP